MARCCKPSSSTTLHKGLELIEFSWNNKALLISAWKYVKLSKKTDHFGHGELNDSSIARWLDENLLIQPHLSSSCSNSNEFLKERIYLWSFIPIFSQGAYQPKPKPSDPPQQRWKKTSPSWLSSSFKRPLTQCSQLAIFSATSTCLCWVRLYQKKSRLLGKLDV